MSVKEMDPFDQLQLQRIAHRTIRGKVSLRSCLVKLVKLGRRGGEVHFPAGQLSRPTLLASAIIDVTSDDRY